MGRKPSLPWDLDVGTSLADFTERTASLTTLANSQSKPNSTKKDTMIYREKESNSRLGRYFGRKHILCPRRQAIWPRNFYRNGKAGLGSVERSIARDISYKIPSVVRICENINNLKLYWFYRGVGAKEHNGNSSRCDMRGPSSADTSSSQGTRSRFHRQYVRRVSTGISTSDNDTSEGEQ